MRLSPATLDSVAGTVARPGYDRGAQAVGIVHLGIGAFHRAHQAAYTDDAMSAGDRDWAITGVSLRSGAVRDQLVPQGGWYSVTERGHEGRTRLIGAVRDVLVASRTPGAAIDALAAPATRIVTTTVTEKGYHRRPDGSLDFDAVQATSGTIYHLLAAAFERRAAAGCGGVTLLPCDNLADNGRVLAELVADWLDRTAPHLSGWFARECACASTMVDRIVPATSAADLDAAEAILGVRDEGAVITEPYRQWVIEDRFAGPRPRWEMVGAQLVSDVRPYETAKLRMLNGAHSALAYLGLAAGHAHVHEAVADPAIRLIVERLMLAEAAATLATAPGQDLPRYAANLLARFGNTALPHRLAQIAMDGSQKIGPRWLDALAINAAAGRTCPATLTALAAWIAFVRGKGHAVDDPMAQSLADLWRSAGRDGIIDALVGAHGLFAARWTATAADKAIIDRALTSHLGL